MCSPRGPALLLAAAVLCAAAPRAPAAEAESDLARLLARLVSGEYLKLEARQDELRREAEALPLPAAENTSPQLGWHTPRLPSAGAGVWVQVDLGEVLPIDAIALVPASGQADARGGAGYGFPLRFRVEVADGPDFRAPRPAGDFTAAVAATSAKRPPPTAANPRVMLVQSMHRVLGRNELVPTRANPDGTYAMFRIQEGRSRRLSSTVSF